MKRSFKLALGVTLLEIMLVLAIAAMVVVMSIRYYQSASTNQKVAATLNAATAIMAAGENYLSSTGSFTGIVDASITPYMPGGVMPVSPWGGGSLSVTAGGGGATYSINVPGLTAGGTGQAVCAQINQLLLKNSKMSMVTCGTIVVTS